jgi:hypothetical protein
VTDSELTQDLIACGSSISAESASESLRPRKGNVCLFVREVGQPYCYLGKVSVSETNLAVKPIRITWVLSDFGELRERSHFQRILQLNRS